VRHRFHLSGVPEGIAGPVITEVGKDGVPARRMIFASFEDNVLLKRSEPEYMRAVEVACEGDPAKLRAWKYGDWSVISGGAFDGIFFEHAKTIYVERFELPLVVRAGTAVVHRASLRVPHWLGEPDLEGLRWYLEDFGLSPFEPAPQIAARTAARLTDIGHNLFASLLAADTDPALLACLRTDLAHTRIEVEAAGSAAIVWDLIRDPETGA
jgi:hypothetical protein